MVMLNGRLLTNAVYSALPLPPAPPLSSPAPSLAGSSLAVVVVVISSSLWSLFGAGGVWLVVAVSVDDFFGFLTLGTSSSSP